MSEDVVRGPFVSEGPGGGGTIEPIGVCETTADLKDEPIVWCIGGDPTSYEREYKPFGNPVLVTAWFDHLRSPVEVIARLIHSKETDRLAIGYAADPLHTAYVFALWFTLHKECQLIVTTQHGGYAAHRFSSTNILTMIELARKEIFGATKRP